MADPGAAERDAAPAPDPHGGGDRDAGPRTAWLPPRAARARKLVLRSQLGFPWLLAAVGVAGLILLAGVILLARADHPGPPWQRAGPAGAFEAGRMVEVGLPPGRTVVVDRRGSLRAFLAPAGACALHPDGEGFARGCEHRRWDAEGRPLTPGPPLERIPVQLVRDGLYVDPTRRVRTPGFSY